MPSDHATLAHHFADLDQQREAARLGMWLFLVTEVLLFGGLFTAYAVYRWSYPEDFAAASHELAAGNHYMGLWLGTINTLVLITSSLTMVLAHHAGERGHTRNLIVFLALTAALGAAFLVVKGFEYYEKFAHHLVPGPNFHFPEEGLEHAQLFYWLYFVMTGLHAAHMIAGIGVLLAIIALAALGRANRRQSLIESAGLYWHLVDVVWIFLFPLLYLIGLH